MCENHYRKWRRWGTPTPKTEAGGRALVPTADRFWAKVDKTGDCWLWTATRYSNGYGNFWNRAAGRKVLAHRYSYELAFGPIPIGLVVMHTCDNRICVNPTHLRLGTTADNQADMARKGRGTKPVMPLRTHCKNGHPLEGNTYAVNTKRTGQPTVRCKTCVREHNQRQYARMQALRGR